MLYKVIQKITGFIKFTKFYQVLPSYKKMSQCSNSGLAGDNFFLFFEPNIVLDHTFVLRFRGSKLDVVWETIPFSRSRVSQALFELFGLWSLYP